MHLPMLAGNPFCHFIQMAKTMTAHHLSLFKKNFLHVPEICDLSFYLRLRFALLDMHIFMLDVLYCYTTMWSILPHM